MQDESRITLHLHHFATSDIRSSDQAQASPGGKDIRHFLKQKIKEGPFPVPSPNLYTKP